PGYDYYFYVRSVNTVGKSAFVEAVGQPSDDASGYMKETTTARDESAMRHTSVAWSAGIQINPAASVVVDIAYEGSGSGDWRTDGFIVGVGYKF
ncbi:Ail/Lom family outer membrane beta-barrel protein, partial [Escherichia coli]